MVTIAYLHDGTSMYDEMFLEHLTKKNNVYFLTFNTRPRWISKKARAIVMREPLHFWADKEWMEGIRTYALFLLRSLLIKLHLRRINPQLVIGCMATKYGFYSAVARTRPTVVIVWGSDVLVAPRSSFLFRFMAKYALKKASAVVVDSEVQKKAVIQLGCLQNRVLMFPWFDPLKETPNTSADEIRRRLGWQNNTIIICTRKHEPIYGVEYFIKAIPFVVKESPQSRFLVLCKGSLTEALMQKARELQVSEYVRFLGMLPHLDAISYVNAADINVSTSFSDGTSASLLEAMALKVPSIVTNIPGNAEWIKDGWNGYLVPVGDSDALAKKLVFLIKNEDVRKRLAENAFKTIEKKVDWRHNSELFSELLLKLTNASQDRQVQLRAVFSRHIR